MTNKYPGYTLGIGKSSDGLALYYQIHKEVYGDDKGENATWVRELGLHDMEQPENHTMMFIQELKYIISCLESSEVGTNGQWSSR